MTPRVKFHSVIIVTDRTVLDDQLQDTIYQLEHVDGVVGRINRKEGEGSKSDKLAIALVQSQIVARLNEIFLMDELTDEDVVSFARTVAHSGGK